MRKPKDHAPARVCSRAADRLLIALLLLVGAYTVHRAVTLRIDSYDAFAYLSNARAMLGDHQVGYFTIRPPLVSLLHIPGAAVARGASVGDPVALILPHLTATLLSLLAAVAVYFALRRPLGTTLALGGTLFFVAERLFVRYASLAMVDLFVTGVAAVTLLVWTRARRDDRWLLFGLTGVLIAAAMLAKYTLALLAVALVVAEIIAALRARRFPMRKALGLALAGVISATLFYAVHHLAFELAGRSLTPESFRGVFDNQSQQAGIGVAQHPEQHAAMLAVVFSPLALALSAGGVVLAALRPEPRDFLFAVWLVVFGGAVVFLVNHNEARYLLPIFPSLAYFAMRAVEGGVIALRPVIAERSWRRRATWLAALGLVALMGWPAVDQMRRDQDPVFTDEAPLHATAWLADHAGPRSRVLLEGFWTLSPDPVLVLEHDEYFDTQCFHETAVQYLAGLGTLRVRVGSDPAAFILGRPGDVLMLGQRDFLDMRDLLAGVRPERSVETWAVSEVILRRAGEGLWSASDGSLTLRAEEGGLSVVPDRDAGRGHLSLADASGAATSSVGAVTLRAGIASTLPRTIGAAPALVLSRPVHARFPEVRDP